jgi:diacylglycerol O-acyltransferase
VRHIALPKPGSMRQLLDLASLIACDPFDRTRPLWQFVVVEGLRGGKSAADPEAAPHHRRRRGRRAAVAAVPRLRARRARAAADRPRPIAAAAGRCHPRAQANQDLLRDLVAGSLRMPLGLLKQIKDLLADPTGIPDAGNAAADTVRGVMQQLGDTEGARSPLWTQRSLQRRMEVLRAPFGETRAAAKRLGGTLNTAFLTAAAEAAGRYHRRARAPVEQLRASMAISTRTESSPAPTRSRWPG